MDPALLVEAYLRRQIKPDSIALTGEAASNPISLSKLPKAPQLKVQKLWQQNGTALVAAEFSDNRSAEDLYVFADSLETGWRIKALRQFELPGVMYMQLNHYRNKGENAIRKDWQDKYQSSAARGVSQSQHEAVHGTEEDRVFYVFNLRLSASADRDIIKHWEFLRKDFDQLRQSLEAMPARPLAYEHDAEIGDQMRYLLIKRSFHPTEGPLRFEIARIEGKALGYLYCNQADCMPTPTPGGIIALYDLGGGWYFYRMA